MPRRVVARYVSWIDKNHRLVLSGLLVVMLILAGLATDGYVKARDAQRRVNTIEFERSQEAIGKRVADVATCFNRARARPQLTIVLRAIAGGLADGEARRAAQTVVNDYERSTPGRADCIALAKKLGVDPSPYLENPEPDGVGSVPQR